MPAGANLAQSVHRLSIRVHHHPLGQMVQGAKLVGVHHEFLVTRDQPALQPTAGVQHEVDPRQKRHVERVCRFIRRLRVRQL